jgi:hypothetical protein
MDEAENLHGSGNVRCVVKELVTCTTLLSNCFAPNNMKDERIKVAAQ